MPPPDPLARIKKAGQDNVKCSKERMELASFQTRILKLMEIELELAKQSEKKAESLRNRCGGNPTFGGPAERFGQETQVTTQFISHFYEKYKADTEKTRNYKDEEEKAEPEVMGGSSSAGATKKSKTGNWLGRLRRSR